MKRNPDPDEAGAHDRGRTVLDRAGGLLERDGDLLDRLRGFRVEDVQRVAAVLFSLHRLCSSPNYGQNPLSPGTKRDRGPRAWGLARV